MRELIKTTLKEYLTEDKQKWTKDVVRDIASQYSTRGEFKKSHSAAYSAALRNGWLDEFMGEGRVSPIKWNLEMLKGIAAQYPTRGDLKVGNRRAYNYMLTRGLLDEFYGTSQRNPSGYWTKEKAHDEALKYTNRRDFGLGSPKAVSAAKANGWWDEITSHMEYLGHLYERAVYAWEFPDNHVYVGLTDDLARREKQHLDPEGRTRVSEHIVKTGLTPLIKKISDYIDVKEAQELERCSVDLYKNGGWIILNKVKAGGLGACKKVWTKDKVEEEAKKYTTRKDFKKNSHSAYVIAVREGWIDDVTQHMTWLQGKPWTIDALKNEISKFRTLPELRKGNPSVYSAVYRLGLSDELFKNLKKRYYPKKN